MPQSTGSSYSLETRILSKLSQRLTRILRSALAQTSYTERAKDRSFFSTDLRAPERRSLQVGGSPQCVASSKTHSESVAEFTKRPLLSITAADLGHEVDALEGNLLRYFRRANDWDAIVLLDEADVYLEKRSTNDLARNSIVSGRISMFQYARR